MVFRIASSPYTHNQRQTSRIMMLVCLGRAAGIAVQCWFFGWGTLFQLVLGCASAVAAEAAILKLRKMEVTRILSDNSALLTGLLLAISIPPVRPVVDGGIGNGVCGDHRQAAVRRAGP